MCLLLSGVKMTYTLLTCQRDWRVVYLSGISFFFKQTFAFLDVLQCCLFVCPAQGYGDETSGAYSIGILYHLKYTLCLQSQTRISLWNQQVLNRRKIA